MFGDTGALSFQLDMYRWEDHVQRMQDIRERNAEQNTADVVIARYNDLVRRYNALAEAAIKAAQAADASQARVDVAEAQIRSKDREITELRQSLHKAEQETELALDEMREAGKSAKHYISRALAAEAELKELRSQND